VFLGNFQQISSALNRGIYLCTIAQVHSDFPNAPYFVEYKAECSFLLRETLVSILAVKFNKLDVRYIKRAYFSGTLHLKNVAHY
jgi:hypothetical protein